MVTLAPLVRWDRPDPQKVGAAVDRFPPHGLKNRNGNFPDDIGVTQLRELWLGMG